MCPGGVARIGEVAFAGEATAVGKVASGGEATRHFNAGLMTMREAWAVTPPKLSKSKLMAPKFLAPNLMAKVMEAIGILAHHEDRGNAEEPGLRRPIPCGSRAPISEIALGAEIVRGIASGGALVAP